MEKNAIDKRSLVVKGFSVVHETAKATLLTIPGAGKVWVGNSRLGHDQNVDGDDIIVIDGWRGMQLKCTEKNTVTLYEDLFTKFDAEGRMVA